MDRGPGPAGQLSVGSLKCVVSVQWPDDISVTWRGFALMQCGSLTLPGHFQLGRAGSWPPSPPPQGLSTHTCALTACQPVRVLPHLRSCVGQDSAKLPGPSQSGPAFGWASVSAASCSRPRSPVSPFANPTTAGRGKRPRVGETKPGTDREEGPLAESEERIQHVRRS